MAGAPISSDLQLKIQRAQLERAEMDKILADRQRELVAIEALYISYEQRLTLLLARQ